MAAFIYPVQGRHPRHTCSKGAAARQLAAMACAAAMQQMSLKDRQIHLAIFVQYKSSLVWPKRKCWSCANWPWPGFGQQGLLQVVRMFKTHGQQATPCTREVVMALLTKARVHAAEAIATIQI